MRFFSFFKNPKFVLVLTLLIVIPFVAWNLFHKEEKILGQTGQLIVASPPPKEASKGANLQAVQESPSPKLAKNTYTIALFGDSMVDTMGENLEYLQKSLSALYGQTKFNLYNYGIGSQNIEQGIDRFEKTFNYQTRSYPPIAQIKADVIVIGSFAYNPFPPHDASRHYQRLLELINSAKSTQSNVYLLAEIAPLENGFGKGPGGINWPSDFANQQSKNILQQLKNVPVAANTTNTALIDAFQKSKLPSGWGNPVYVNAHDGIHPSVQGHVLMSNLIARAIKLK